MNFYSMIQLETTQTVPLRMEEGGAIRVGNTGVTLDVVIARFKDGDTAEDIQQSFPTLRLKDVYAALACYLAHQEEVESYLRERDAEAAELRRFWENHPKSSTLRARLRALKEQQAK